MGTVVRGAGVEAVCPTRPGPVAGLGDPRHLRGQSQHLAGAGSARQK